VKNPRTDVTQSFTYYQAPEITGLSPTFGPVKPDTDTDLTIKGSGFVCPNGDCKDVQIRFTDSDDNKIYMPCQLVDSSTIKVLIPKYTRPDVLTVEASMNGIDYTNSQKTYGFFDPYIIDAKPRLISVKGTTLVTVKGLGFVDSGQLDSKFSG